MLPGITVPALATAVVEPQEPIWEAAVNGHWNIVKWWLQRDPSLINVIGEATFEKKEVCKELTLLHLAVALDAGVEVLKYLVAAGADVNAMSEDNSTPLFSAAWGKNVEIVRYLISQGAEFNTKGFNGYTLLHAAACSNSIEVLQCLILQGADVNAQTDYGDRNVSADGFSLGDSRGQCHHLDRKSRLSQRSSLWSNTGYSFGT
jgi:ankyrin repeat protein